MACRHIGMRAVEKRLGQDIDEGMGDRLFLSTSLVEPDLRSDYWREMIAPFFDAQPLESARNTHLEGSVDVRFIAGLIVSRTTFGAQHLNRSRRLALTSEMSDFYMLELFTAANGKMDFQGHTITIEAGDVCVWDLGRAFTSQFSAGSGLPLVFPRAPLDRALGGRPLDGLVLKAGLPVTRLISDLVMSLDRLPSMGIEPALAIEEAVTKLLVSVISGRAIDELPEDPVLSPIFRQRVLQFIDANLHRPDLDLALLMQQFRVSRPHLYRMFAGDGGVRAVIRDRRLNAAYRQLLSHRSKTGSITSIAHELGFSSSNQFLRAFREQFGVTPSEVRYEGMSIASGEAERGFEVYLRKVKR